MANASSATIRVGEEISLVNDLPCACSFVFNSYKFVLKHDIFTSEYYINCFFISKLNIPMHTYCITQAA